MIRLIGGSSLIFLTVSVVFGQSAQPPRAFEVASVKVHDGLPQSMGISTSGATLTAEAETVNGLVMWAYNLKNYKISFARSISGDDVFYDIFAKAEGNGVARRRQAKAPAPLRPCLHSLWRAAAAHGTLP
jgi:hypothetical protein